MYLYIYCTIKGVRRVVTARVWQGGISRVQDVGRNQNCWKHFKDWYKYIQIHKIRSFLVLPRKLTYHLKIDGWKTTFLLKWSLFRGHVSFGGYKLQDTRYTVNKENQK